MYWKQRYLKVRKTKAFRKWYKAQIKKHQAKKTRKSRSGKKTSKRSKSLIQTDQSAIAQDKVALQA